MNNILENQGVLQVVLEEYEKHKLPRIFLIKKHIDNGDRLNDGELIFLKEIYKEIIKYESFIEDHAEFKTLYLNFVSLYCSIMDSALENERRQNKASLDNR